MTAGASEGAPRERTLLAWHRTSLALVVGCAALARYGSEVVGPQASVLAIVGLVLAAASSILALLRYRRSRTESIAAHVRDDGDGRRFAALAASVVAVGFSVLVIVVAGAL